jgi:hypothetical protein
MRVEAEPRRRAYIRRRSAVPVGIERRYGLYLVLNGAIGKRVFARHPSAISITRDLCRNERNARTDLHQYLRRIKGWVPEIHRSVFGATLIAPWVRVFCDSHLLFRASDSAGKTRDRHSIVVAGRLSQELT